MNLYEYFKALSLNEDKMLNPVTMNYNEDKTLVSIKYNMFSPSFSWDLPYIQNARGLVLEVETGDVVALPYPKFFNYNENKYAKWPDDIFKMQVQEKLDGSLVIVSRYNNKLLVASSGSLTSLHSQVFKEYFEKNLTDEQLESLFNLTRDFTLLFEYVSPENKIVLNYEKENMILHGMIPTSNDLDNVSEVSYDSLVWYADEIGVDVIKQYDFDSFDEIMDYLDGKTNFEGFVVKFNSNYRLKFKTEDYVKLHKVSTQLDLKVDTKQLRQYFIQAIIEDYQDDLIPFLSESTRHILNEMNADKKDFIEKATKLKKSYLVQIDQTNKIDEKQIKNIIFNYHQQFAQMSNKYNIDFQSYMNDKSFEEILDKGFAYYEQLHNTFFNEEKQLFKYTRESLKKNGLMNKEILTNQQKREVSQRENTSEQDKYINSYLFGTDILKALEDYLTYFYVENATLKNKLVVNTQNVYLNEAINYIDKIALNEENKETIDKIKMLVNQLKGE